MMRISLQFFYEPCYREEYEQELREKYEEQRKQDLIEHGRRIERQWKNASNTLPDEYTDRLLVIASGRVGNVRYRHAVLFAEYFPDSGFEVNTEGVEGVAKLKVEYWHSIPPLPEEIRKEMEG